MRPAKSAPFQLSDNIYAPDVMWVGDKYYMWYGGQGFDGRDRIFLARSPDGVTWTKYPSDTDPQPVVTVLGSTVHVNDPSVVRVNGTFYMFFTVAHFYGLGDRINMAKSNDGINWNWDSSVNGMVFDVGAPGTWEDGQVGRPSVLYEDGQFHMWYDGRSTDTSKGRHVGYATSADGRHWTRYAKNPIIQNQGAVDVDKVNGFYALLSEARAGTNYFLSQDRLNFQAMGRLFSRSGSNYDAYGQVTPHLLVKNNASGIKYFYFGGASESCWCKNRIGIARLH